MDLIERGGGNTCCYLNVGGETTWDAASEPLKQRIERGLERMAAMAQMRVILINLISNLVPCDEMATVIGDYFRSRLPPAAEPILVVRLIGCQGDRARQVLAKAHLTLVTDLEAAVSQAIALAYPDAPPTTAR